MKSVQLLFAISFVFQCVLPMHCVAQSCDPQWEVVLGNPGISSGDISTIVEWDAGNGPRLFVGGSAQSIGGTSSSFIAAFDSNVQEWQGLGSGIVSGSQPAYVSKVFSCGPGFGNKLLVGGQFASAGGIEGTRNLAFWDGGQWSSTGADFSEKDAVTFDMFAADFGDGPKMFLAGNWQCIGGVQVGGLACFDGESFSPWGIGDGVGSLGGEDSYVKDLEHWITAESNAIYACGKFQTVDNAKATNVARYNLLTSTWESVGVPLTFADPSKGLTNFAKFDDGSGEALYVAGGSFQIAGDPNFYSVAKWDGNDWTGVGQSLGGQVLSLAVWFDGNERNLYLCGTELVAVNYFAKLVDGTWRSALSGVNNPSVNGSEASACELYPWGRRLVIGGDFARVGGLDPVTGQGSGAPVASAGLAAISQLILGDVDFDGRVNLLDINPFVDIVATGRFVLQADVNKDGSVNLQDINPFVELLVGLPSSSHFFQDGDPKQSKIEILGRPFFAITNGHGTAIAYIGTKPEEFENYGIPIYQDVAEWGRAQEPPVGVNLQGDISYPDNSSANIPVCIVERRLGVRNEIAAIGCPDEIVALGGGSFEFSWNEGWEVTLRTLKTAGAGQWSFDEDQNCVSHSQSWSGYLELEVTGRANAAAALGHHNLLFRSYGHDVSGSSLIVPKSIKSASFGLNDMNETFPGSGIFVSGESGNGSVVTSWKSTFFGEDFFGQQNSVANDGPFRIGLNANGPSKIDFELAVRRPLIQAEICDAVIGAYDEAGELVAQGFETVCDALENICVIGDSFYNDGPDISGRLAGIGGYNFLDNTYAIPGAKLSGAINALANKDLTGVDLLIIGRGINDVASGATLSQMRERVTAIADSAGDINVVMANVPPFGQSVVWSQARQDVADAYNDWLPGFVATRSNIEMLNINSILDRNGDGDLDAEFDSGDGLHPSNSNGGGTQAVARAYNKLISARFCGN